MDEAERKEVERLLGWISMEIQYCHAQIAEYETRKYFPGVNGWTTRRANYIQILQILRKMKED